MPRGKYVNHKGRSRHFTSPEELAQASDESSEEETTTGESGNEEKDETAGAVGGSTKSNKASTSGAGTSSSGKHKTLKNSHNSKPRKSAGGRNSPSEEESDSDDDDDDASEDEEDMRDAKKGVASLIEIENPNRVVRKAAQKITTLNLEDNKPAKPELSRREREQIEKQKARQRYEKLHAAGKTTEAKADLARLALIRQQRAEAAAKREANKKIISAKD